MAVLLYVLTVLLVHGQQASGQGTPGVSLELNGSPVPNFALLGHSQIDTDDDTVANTSLVCRTDNTSCCRGADNPNGGGFGEWLYPNGTRVVFPFVMPLPAGVIYRQRRRMQTLRLYRDDSASITATANGIYRCEVADQNGVIQTRYVGLYTDGAGVVSISEAPQFSLISDDPLEFTLTSTTTGGPPTSVFWTLPNTAMATGDTTLLNGLTATVRHTLTVTGRMPGVYMFSTTNARSGPPVSSSITVQDTNPPTGLMAVQDGLTSILVSWTAPAPGIVQRTGYRIFYQTGGGSEQSVDVGAGATSHTLTGLQSGAAYSISIVARSSQLPSTVVGPEMVILNSFEAPIVMTSVLGPTSIRVTFAQPSGSLAAESYDIQYTRVIGAGQTLCGSVQDTGTTTDIQSSFNITNLEEFSSYDITVTARVFSAMRTSTEQAMTSPTAPAAAPRDLVSTTVLSTSITVGWDPVVCIERNGVIDNYIVRFGPEGGVQSEQTVDTTRTHSVSGLSPSTRYSFSVAAMNSAGTGPFTATPLIVETSALSPPTGLMAVQDSLTSVLVSWTVPASDSSVTTGYLITYTRTSGSGPQSVTVTGYSTTSRTLSSLERGATYSITIVSLNGTSSSSVEGPVMVTVREFVAPTVAAQVSGPTSIRVTFTQPSGSLAAESYDILYIRVIGAGQTLCDSVEDTGATTDVQSPFTITNLEEFSSYDITVTAHAFVAMRATTERTMTSPAAPTAAPRGLTNTTFLNTSITVQWDTVECIDQNRVIESYVVRYGVSASPSQRQNISVLVADPRAYTASGLTPFTRYSFEVAAVNSAAGTGPFTAPLIVETARNSPTAPVNVASLSQSPTSITLSWEQPAGDFIDNYIIVYTYQGECSDYTQPENMATVNDGTAREYTLENLQEFSGYAITVTAVITGGGSTSDMITATTLADAPSGPPQSVMTSSVTSSSIMVQWGRVSCIDRNSEITSYTVRYGQTGSTTTVMESVSGTSVSDRMFTASGLLPRTSYTFEVAAVSSEGIGPFSTGTTVETAAPDVPVPDPPVVTLGVVTATTVTLSWSPQPGVGQYEVHYVRAVGSQQHGACPDFIDTLNTEATTENSLTVAGLQEFSTYTVTVFAVNNAGQVPSEEVVITTPEAAPAPPRGVEVVNFTDTAITVHWKPLECIDINSQFEITGYAVRYGFSHEHGISTEISSSLPVRTINVLAPGFEYFIKVAAVNSNGETGEYSNRIIQTTSGGQSPGSAGGTETATVAAASVVVVLVVLILALSSVVIAVLVLKHKRGAPPLTQQPPTEAMVLTTFPESTKPPAAISTGPNAAYQTVASVGRGQSQGNDGDHTYECIVPPGLQSRDQPEPPHVYEST